MEEFQKFKVWVDSLFLGSDFEWDSKGQEDQLQIWLKERENAAFHWAWNRAARQVTVAEKKRPLNETEIVWLEHFDFTVELLVKCELSQYDEFSQDLWDFIGYICKDFQLLARAARLDLSNPYLEKLRAEYDAGRFPRGLL